MVREKREERVKRDGGMESLRGPGGCNLLSVVNTQQMCGAEDRERRRGAG